MQSMLRASLSSVHIIIINIMCFLTYGSFSLYHNTHPSFYIQSQQLSWPNNSTLLQSAYYTYTPIHSMCQGHLSAVVACSTDSSQVLTNRTALTAMQHYNQWKELTPKPLFPASQHQYFSLSLTFHPFPVTVGRQGALSQPKANRQLPTHPLCSSMRLPPPPPPHKCPCSGNKAMGMELNVVWCGASNRPPPLPSLL